MAGQLIPPCCIPAKPLAPEQRRALGALAGTFIQKMPEAQEGVMLKEFAYLNRDDELLRAAARTTGEDLAVAEAVEELLAKMRPDKVREIHLLTTLLASRFGTLVLFGVCGPFADLAPEKRESALQAMRDSCIMEKREIFCQLKSIVLLNTMNRDTSAVNPLNKGIEGCVMWQALGYEGPDKREDVEKVANAAGRHEHVFSTLNATITSDTELKFDVVVVGSGCGGGVVAGELAKAGHSVLVLEKGAYLKRSEITGEEGQGFSFFQNGGTLYDENNQIAILAANAFGGGTQVNWACCLKPPPELRKQWATEFGLEQFVGEDFEASIDAVWKRLSVKSGEDVSHNRSNQILLDACKKLGWPAGPAGQNMADTGPFPPGAGFINNGDRHGLKQSMPETYLRDAATAGQPASFLDRCYVERVLHEGGVATGVKARVVGGNGATHLVTVRAPVVVVSGGSMQSPLLLMRSGLPNRNGQIGKNLFIHPVEGAYGFFGPDQPEVHSWRGAPMSSVCSVVGDDGYGVKLEVPAGHPGMVATQLPWVGAHEFKKLAMTCTRLFPVIALARDKCSGEVWEDGEGYLHVKYKMDSHCEGILLDGVERSIRILEAAGVEKIFAGQLQGPRVMPPTSDPKAREAALNEVLAEVKRVRFRRGQVSLFSAHQMGTCRMSAKPEQGVVKPSCESWEIKGLYVVDASTFPTASGVNPMITTLSIAHFTAQGIKARLGQAKQATNGATE